MVESVSRFSSGSAILQGVKPLPRPDPAKMAETLVANLDTAKKGYLEVSDLQTAFAQNSTANSTTAVQNAQQVFSAFDSNGDGQATTTEITTTLQALADRQQQGTGGAQAGVMQQGMGPGGAGGQGGAGGPPPPPATTGTSAATTVSDPADTNGDGTVSATEAIAAIQSTLAATTTQTTAATTASNTTTAASAATATATTTTTAANGTPSTTSTATDALQRRIMQLMDAYGLQQNTQQTRTGAASSYQSGLSIMA